MVDESSRIDNFDGDVVPSMLADLLRNPQELIDNTALRKAAVEAVIALGVDCEEGDYEATPEAISVYETLDELIGEEDESSSEIVEDGEEEDEEEEWEEEETEETE